MELNNHNFIRYLPESAIYWFDVYNIYYQSSPFELGKSIQKTVLRFKDTGTEEEILEHWLEDLSKIPPNILGEICYGFRAK